MDRVSKSKLLIEVELGFDNAKANGGQVDLPQVNFSNFVFEKNEVRQVGQKVFAKLKYFGSHFCSSSKFRDVAES